MTDEAQVSDWSTRKRCDHICLLDDGHVERGEVHQYGYEVPSARQGELTTEALLAELLRRGGYELSARTVYIGGKYDHFEASVTPGAYRVIAVPIRLGQDRIGAEDD